MEKKRVLIVDDEPEIRQIIVDTLQTHFAVEIIQACNGQEGFEALKNNQVDLMITDLAMPVVNGFEFLRRLKVTGMKVPTIVLTGHGDRGVSAQLKAFGVIEFLNKPWHKEEVLKAVGRILNAGKSEKVG